MKYRICWIVIPVLFAALPMAVAQVRRAAPPPVKIGVLTDLSGQAAYWGKQTQLGVEIALKELNSVRPGTVAVVYGDHQLSTQMAVTEAQKLIAVDDVDAIYSEFTATASAAANVVRTQPRLYLASCAATSPLESSPFVFKTYLDYEAGCARIAKRWSEQGVRRLGILKATAEFGELCATGAKRVDPDLIEIEYKYGDDVATQVLVLKQRGIEAVLNPTYEGDLERMLKSMKAIDYAPFVGANADAVNKDSVRAAPTLSGRLVTFGFQGVTEEFERKLMAADPGNSLVAREAAAQGYLHLKQLVKVIEVCGRSDIHCITREFATLPANELLGFREFRGRVAAFDVALRECCG